MSQEFEEDDDEKWAKSSLEDSMDESSKHDDDDDGDSMNGDVQSIDSSEKSSQWMVTGTMSMQDIQKIDARVIDSMDTLQELMIAALIGKKQKKLPTRTDHLRIFLNSHASQEDNIVSIPIWGFFQSRSVAVSVWRDWLGKDQKLLNWTKISDTIEFLPEYIQIMKQHNDASREWHCLGAGMRKRFLVWGTGWKFSGSIQVQTSSPSSDLLSLVKDTFLTKHLPPNNPKPITYLNIQCDITPLAQFDPTSTPILSVHIRGFLQTTKTEMHPLITWLDLFSFVKEYNFEPLRAGLGANAEFQATRSANESTAGASPWYTIHEMGKFKTKLTDRKSTAPKASDGRMRAFSRCAHLLF